MAINLSGLDLSGFDLSGLDLTGANLTGANLQDAVLSGVTSLALAIHDSTTSYSPTTIFPPGFDPALEGWTLVAHSILYADVVPVALPGDIAPVIGSGYTQLSPVVREHAVAGGPRPAGCLGPIAQPPASLRSPAPGPAHARPRTVLAAC